ncbi:MAG: hypothetical protein BZY88_17645 [SAR202 cluster bacterium Io17-Chloro-G9]|nr:MAG: hypothetical protein BZY88_17645 [SAR202 cluster bacterium Io17-Chloro-G9]
MTTEMAQEMEAKRERIRRLIPADPGESATAGVNHLAVFAKDLEVTAEFYSGVLGMPVVNVTANRDVAESTHMNIHIGNGTMLSFFDFPHVPRQRRKAPEGVGGIMHIALPMNTERLDGVEEKLKVRHVKYQQIGGSLYFKDPNGLGIEFMPAG